MEPTPEMKKLKILNIILWVLQCLLAAIYLMTGFTKLTMPMDKLVTMIFWTKDVPALLVRFIGISELSGALGLLLPAIFRIKPKLTPIAAAGLATIMLFATVFHISRGEIQSIGITIVLGSVAAFVAWGRFRKVPVQPK